MSSVVTIASIAALVFVSTLILVLALVREGRAFLVRYRETFTESASSNLSDMFLFVNPGRLFYLSLAATVLLPLLVWLATRNVVFALASAGVMLVLPQVFYRSMRNKRLKAFEHQLPDGLQMLAGALRAGASLNVALEGLVREQPAPLSQEFELLTREQRIGVEFDAALSHMEARLPIQDFQMLVSALRINREVGGNLAEILETLADTLRRKQTMEGKIDSLTAQGKMQGIVMACLPVLLILVLFQLESDSMDKLFTTRIGWAVTGTIVVMETLGFLMIRKITTIDV
jgi:tight adherence protein B